MSYPAKGVRLFVRRLLLIFLFMLCSVVGALFYFLEKELVDFTALGYYSSAQPSVVLDDEGREIGRFELDRRDPVTYDKLPDVLVKAFVAAEDHHFFEHSGISFRGIVRSFLVNLYHGRYVQGASTITQQLARGMFLSYNRTLYRKMQEIFLAFQLERQLSKEQIMELYLNNIYFGRGIYGVEAACRRFWNKQLDALTVAEAATLAAVAKSALLYSPLNAPCSAKKRRNLIITSMKNLGFITDREYEKASKAKLVVLDYMQGNPIRLYILEWVRTWAEGIWGREALYRNGMRFKTTINLETQAAAEQAFATSVQELRRTFTDQLNGGLVALESATGKIRAFVGGFNFKQSQYNRAFQASRQMGSSFKPFIYSCALEQGMELDRVMVDEPLEMNLPNGQVWTPKNWNDQFEGPMTLARALTVSNNIIAIKLFMELGIEKVVDWAARFGFRNPVPAYPSAALGTLQATVEENAAAFNVFAHDGVYVKPFLVEHVKDRWGAKLWEYDPVSRRVISSKLASKMVNALSFRTELYKQQSSKGWIDADAIAKTGSTNGAASVWFVGATPDLTTAVYVGRDDDKPMGTHVFASQTVFPLWLNFYKALTTTKKHFYSDSTLKPVTIDWVTGLSNEYVFFGAGDDDRRVIKILKG